MGLFDIFKKKDGPGEAQSEEKLSPEPNEGAVTADGATDADQGYLGDLEKTGRLAGLIALPREERDQQWVSAFLADLPLASFRCLHPQVIAGPDGFPYFQLALPVPGEEFQCFVVDKMKDDFLLERGYGVVINPESGQPDWVLSYGDILNYHLRGEFFTSESDFGKNLQDEITPANEEVMVGQPSEYLLPAAARKLLREFFQLNNIPDPKILLMMRKIDGELIQELAFNITPAQFENEEQYRNMMQTVTWYLPRHYSILGMNETTLEGFEPL